MIKNQVIRITLTGGLIGLFTENPRKKLEDKIQDENNRGWRVIQVLPDLPGNLIVQIIRLILLTITFFLYTQADGYLVVLEKKD